MRSQLELRARLAALENQIAALQTELQQGGQVSVPMTKFPSLAFTGNGHVFSTDIVSSGPSGPSGPSQQEHLKAILLQLKTEHEAVLQNIDRALELVTTSPQSSPSVKLMTAGPHSSPLSGFGAVQLRDRISAAINSPGSRCPDLRTGGVSPAVEKSYITFDILNDLENRKDAGNSQHPFDGKSRQKRQHVLEQSHGRHPSVSSSSSAQQQQQQQQQRRQPDDNFAEDVNLSMASQEYLKKYGLW